MSAERSNNQAPAAAAAPVPVEYKMQWKNLSQHGLTQGRLPTPRCNHGVCSIGKYVFVIGGRGEGDDLRYNDTHILDTETMTWQEIVATKGDAPVPSSSFTLSVVDGIIYMFGGKHKDGYMNGLYTIEHSVNGVDEEGNLQHVVTWTQPMTIGEGPCPRYLHTAAVVGHRIYIFGGCTVDEHCLNDLHVFNTRDYTWDDKPAVGVSPTARARHSCGVFGGNKLLFFGGLDKENNIFGDFTVLNTDKREWSNLKTYGQVPPATYGHSMNSFGSRLLVFGGVSETDGESVNDTYVLNTATLEWSKVVQDGDLPEYRNGHRTTIVHNNCILVAAGWHRRYLGDFLKLETGILDSHKEYRASLFAPHVEIAKRSRLRHTDVVFVDNSVSGTGENPSKKKKLNNSSNNNNNSGIDTTMPRLVSVVMGTS